MALWWCIRITHTKPVQNFVFSLKSTNFSLFLLFGTYSCQKSVEGVRFDPFLLHGQNDIIIGAKSFSVQMKPMKLWIRPNFLLKEISNYSWDWTYFLRVKIWESGRSLQPSFWSWPKSYTFFKPPMGMFQFGILFGSYLSSIPEIPQVPLKSDFSKFSNFSRINGDSTKLVGLTRNMLSTKMLLRMSGIFYVLTLWKNVNKQLTYTRLNGFHVFMKTTSFATTLSNF